MLVAGATASTPARQVAVDEPVVVLAADGEYVSRGGHKLAAALDAFALDVRDRRAVDVGSSTGGFTDCLLQRGAAHVYAVDVGRGQLAWSLRQDPRVTVMERTNVRDLEDGALQPPPDVCVADVSFISLRMVAPNLLMITAPEADFVVLVKPQYEAGRARAWVGVASCVTPRCTARCCRRWSGARRRRSGCARGDPVAIAGRRRKRRVPRARDGDRRRP